MNDITDFAAFVVEKRRAMGFSTADLSEKVFGNRRDNYISDLESGRRKGITFEVMVRILRALNSELSVNEL
jgi:ribosome-binding protein aMBF1 (putative translation factor)